MQTYEVMDCLSANVLHFQNLKSQDDFLAATQDFGVAVDQTMPSETAKRLYYDMVVA